jgi:hypothetical protein
MPVGGAVDHASVELLEIVRDVTAEFAPEELPLVDALALLPPDEVGRRLVRATSRDDPLGFGMGEVAAVVVPVVWVAVQQVVNQLATSAADGLAARTRVALRKWRHKPAPSEPLPHFDQLQLDEVHQNVQTLAIRAGMPPERAELLGHRVVERLRKPGAGQEQQ